MPSHSLYTGLRPDAALHGRGALWIPIPREEATRICAQVPVAVIMGGHGFGARASWWNRNNPLFHGGAPVDVRALRFFRYVGPGHEIHRTTGFSSRATEAGEGAQALARGGQNQSAPAATNEHPRAAKQCTLKTLNVECSHQKWEHGRKTEHRHARPGSSGGAYTLEVVEGQAGDEITLDADLHDPCGDHPKWVVQGEEHAQKKYKFKAKPRALEAGVWNLLGIAPHVYDVSLKTCSGDTSVQIKAYPADELEFQWVLWEGGEYEPRTRAERRREERALRKEERHRKTKKVSLARWYNDFRNRFDDFNKHLEDPIEIKFLAGALSFVGAWSEDDESQQVFYNWEIAGGFNPLLEITATKRIRPGWLALVPEIIRKYVGDLALILELSGEAKLTAGFGQVKPHTIEGNVKLEGEITGSVGGELRVGPKSGRWQLLKVTVKAATGFGFEGKRSISDKPEVEIEISWIGVYATFDLVILGVRPHELEEPLKVKIWDKTTLAKWNWELGKGEGEAAPTPPPQMHAGH